MILTKEGLLFKDRVEEILALYDKAKLELMNNQEVRGEIFIGSGETDAFYYLAGLIAQFQKKHPNVQFHIISGDSDIIKENVDKGLIDIGFLFEPVNIENYFIIKTEFNEKWGIICPLNHKLANCEYVTPNDLADEKLIIPQRMLFQREINQWFGKSIDYINIVATYNLINSAIMMTQKEIGITICIEKNMYKDIGFKFIPLKPYILANPMFIWKDQKIFSNAVE